MIVIFLLSPFTEHTKVSQDKQLCKVNNYDSETISVDFTNFFIVNFEQVFGHCGVQIQQQKLLNISVLLFKVNKVHIPNCRVRQFQCL